ncbi:hypothetical protein [uncultured Mediterranean phage uvMED]|nr:hypothetical protein [uncultured Mediterranean phage uvMED]
MVKLEKILEAIDKCKFEYSNDQIEIANDYWLDYDFIVDRVDDITGFIIYDVVFSIKSEDEDMDIPDKWEIDIENKLIEKYS